MKHFALALALLSGCIVVDSESHSNEVVNYSPAVIYGEAGVYWDERNRDDIWFFEAEVDDHNGPGDIVKVWADVYDFDGGDLYIESFELYPTNDPWIWFSDWLGTSTWLDPYYHGYVVDIVAYDSYEVPASLSVRPAVY